MSIRGRSESDQGELITAAEIDDTRSVSVALDRGKWLQASASIARQVLTGDPEDAFRMILDEFLELAVADLVMIVVPGDDPGRVRIELAVGVDHDRLQGLEFAGLGTVTDLVLRTGTPRLIPNPQRAEELRRQVPGLARLGSELLLPLPTADGVRAVLTAARLVGGPAFTTSLLDLAADFAVQTALALELCETRAEQQRTIMAGERERIAADLHDHVIQRLFAAGLSLQSVAAGLGPGRQADRIAETVGDLDDTIRQIRTTIFKLQLPGREQTPGLRVRLLDAVTEVTPALGFEPAVRFAGVLESALLPDVTDDLLAALREALSNVVRHAGASSVEIEVSVGSQGLSLEVWDDGVGIATTDGRRSGLLNLHRRAQRYGGQFSIEATPPRGTRLRWSVPAISG